MSPERQETNYINSRMAPKLLLEESFQAVVQGGATEAEFIILPELRQSWASRESKVARIHWKEPHRELQGFAKRNFEYKVEY